MNHAEEGVDEERENIGQATRRLPKLVTDHQKAALEGYYGLVFIKLLREPWQAPFPT